MNLNGGTYQLQGISFNQLAEEFGTPLYIYDAEKIVSQVNSLQEAFSGVPFRIHYAVKALTSVSILKLMRKSGLGVDVVSIQEVQIALRAGFSPDEIMYTPNCVDFEEICVGVDLGLHVNLDNLSVLEKFGKKYGGRRPCGLRLNPGIMAGGNYKVATGHNQSKFGIPLAQLPEVLNLVNQYRININGLHIHTGSELTGVEVFMKMADTLFGLTPEFPDLKFLDFGGGFKVAYREGDEVTDIPLLGKSLVKKFRDRQSKLELWIQPGKYLVSEAGYLLVKTAVVKPTPEITFVGVNSGLNHLIRPMMYEAYHEIVNVSNPSGKKKTYTVVGNICETDTLGADRSLSEVREGDLLVIRNAGAYGYSMASNYNSRLRPAEVMVIDGKAKLIRKRDTLDWLLQGQVDIL